MIVTAHRGNSGEYPENTMLAFRKAEEAGCDEIELDVQLTRDNEVVVIHDEMVDRTTNGSGAVMNFTLSELRKLDAGQGEKIPTFREYCEWVATTGLSTNIELKTGCVVYPDIEEKVVAILEEYGLRKPDRVLFSSFNHMTLAHLREIAPDLQCGALIGKVGLSVNAGYYCKKFGFAYLHPDYHALTEERVAELKAHDVGLNVWTVDGLEKLDWLYKVPVRSVITNYPAAVRSYLDGKRWSENMR